VTMKRLEDLQPDGVAGHPDRIELEADRVREVLERVVEPGVPAVAEFGVDAEQDGRDEHEDEKAVLRPDAGGPDRPGSPRREPARRPDRRYAHAALPRRADGPARSRRPVLVCLPLTYRNISCSAQGAHRLAGRCERKR